MPRPILIDQQQAETAQQEAAKKKSHGANPKTVGTLAALAKNGWDFAVICDQWEEGKASIRKKKKRFEELLEEDKVTPDAASTEAWSMRPQGCSDLYKAMVIRAKHYRKLRDELFKSHAVQKMDDPLEKLATLEYEKTRLNSKIQALGRSMGKHKRAKAQSMIPTEFPFAYGFMKQQEATQKLKEMERRNGGPLSEAERIRAFPCLQKGWPDNIDPRMKFEAENDARQKRLQKQAEDEQALVDEGEEGDEGEEEDEDDIVLDEQELQAPLIDDEVVDRRFDEEPKKAKPRYKKQPKSFNPASPSLLQAAEEEAAAAGVPVNEGKSKAKKRMVDDDDSVDGDVPGSLSASGTDDESANSEPHRKRFKPPSGQGTSYDSIFGEDGDEASDDESDHHEEHFPANMNELVMGEDGNHRVASPPPQGFEDSDDEEQGY